MFPVVGKYLQAVQHSPQELELLHGVLRVEMCSTLICSNQITGTPVLPVLKIKCLGMLVPDYFVFLKKSGDE